MRYPPILDQKKRAPAGALFVATMPAYLNE